MSTAPSAAAPSASPAVSAAPRLDRLSALLDGLAPTIEVLRPSPDPAGLTCRVDPTASREDAASTDVLWLHLLVEGEMSLQWGQGETLTVQGPGLAICRADVDHTLQVSATGDLRHLVCVRASLTGPVGALLLDEFARPQGVELADGDDSLRLVVMLLASELATPRCGQPGLLERAGGILFIGLLRHLIARPGHHGAGLLQGLADPRIARALVAMHERPQAPWSLESLAHESGMSRTAFATRFRAVMQRTPGKYLASIRLAMARRAVDQGKGLKQAARESGYANTSALSRALATALVRSGSG